jgi:hypothetical protein
MQAAQTLLRRAGQLAARTAGEDILAGHGVRGGKAMFATLRWRLIAVPSRLIRHALWPGSAHRAIRGTGQMCYYRSLIHDVHWCFTWFQGQPGSGEASFDEAGPVLDLLQAVPDDLDQVAEAGDGEVGQHAAFKH